MSKQEKTLEDLLDIAQQLVFKVDALVASNEKLLSRIAIPAQPRPVPDLSLLTEHQQRVFAELELIKGNDAKARRKAQTLLRQLEGQRATEAFVLKVKNVLKQHDWGVRCRCGEAAMVMWQRNKHCASGGLMGFSHSVGGFHQVHSSRTTIHNFTVVPKSDKRLTKKA